MLPIISFVGRGKSGKTTFLEKLIPELTGRGYRIATIKHTVHNTTFDQPEKDTARHIKAGSSATAIASPSEFAIMRPTGEMTFDEMLRSMGDDYDLIITEGFKRESGPKIEVHRKEKGAAIAGELEGVVAILTDEPLDLNIKQFSLNDVRPVADFIESEYIRPNKERVTLFVNHNQVALSGFPEKMTENLVAAIVSSLKLKGAEEIKSIDISVRK
jgi:molybdopterin-guanine dinucleotide biosynthesis adapter protein